MRGFIVFDCFVSVTMHTGLHFIINVLIKKSNITQSDRILNIYKPIILSEQKILKIYDINARKKFTIVMDSKNI